MLLFNPSLGQITDRFHILTLKQRAYKDKGWDTFSLDKEKEMCEDAIVAARLLLDGTMDLQYDSLSRELYEQNLKQWRSEDELRPLIEKYTSAKGSLFDVFLLAQTAVDTHKGNENRNRLICAIDALFNLPTEPKVYNE